MDELSYGDKLYNVYADDSWLGLISGNTERQALKLAREQYGLQNKIVDYSNKIRVVYDGINLLYKKAS